MNQVDRLRTIQNLLENRRLVTFQQMQEACEVSRATLQRDIEVLRNQFNNPILYDRNLGGYRYDRETEYAGGQIPLPYLWFTSQEIHALLTMQHLLANLDPGGLLAPHVQPLMSRLNLLLGEAKNPAEEIRRRVLLVGIGKRAMKLDHFEKAGAALLHRQRLEISYYARSTNEESTREVSPQRLVHYRENWYLDAWCHLRKGLRNFAVDSIRSATIIDRPAREVPRRTVENVLGPGYGIFTGEKVATATLRFTPERARWVATESWHPDQVGKFAPDGSYILKLPYADDRELMMDILKYGADCEVVGPAALRKSVVAEISRMQQRYPGSLTP
jgi:predicted DNA-binding transcriptional regulator YafY